MRSLADRTVDLLVIGGGIIGAGIARDAALRGLSVALIEQDDLASGTTSRPTRLIHGGLRYLEMFDFGLVRSDMKERENLLRIARHLVFPLPFLLPLYRRGPLYRLKLRTGMVLYDALSRKKSLPTRKKLSRADTLALEPGLEPEGLMGAWRFYDAQVPYVERLVVENAIDAAEHGALVLNHALAASFLREGARVSGALVRDLLGGRELSVRAKATVIATGPWLDRTLTPVRPAKPLLRLTKGIHLVTPRATRHAHVLFADDDRLFFVLPWGDLTLVGTTDTDFDGDPATAAASVDDVRYLVDAACRAFPSAPLDRILYTYAGVRALVREEGVSEGKVSRKHAIYDHEKRDRLRGLISVVGGKITAYRAIAEEVTDLVVERVKARGRSTTAKQPLPGARDDGIAAPASVSAATWARLGSIYGSRAGRVLARAGDDGALLRPLCPHHAGVAAEVDHAVGTEWARTIGDVMLRRTMLGLAQCQGLDALDAVADRMAALLGWDAAQRRAEIDRYRREIEPMRRFATA